MSETWYYAHKKRPIGPLNLADLRANIQKNPNWKDLLVWRDGFADWQRADSVKEILALFVTPPPIPTSAAEALKSGSKHSIARTTAAVFLGIVVVAAAAAGGAYWQTIAKEVQDFLSPPAQIAAVGSLEKRLADAALSIRAGLPRRIDATTTLVAVRYDATKLIYENSIAMEGAKFDEAMRSKLRQSVTRNICAMADTRRVLELGGSFRYVYEDIDAKPLLTIDVAKQNCT